MVPKLWDETVDAHRRAVREAILDTAAALVSSRGLRAVTMSRVAEETGIGRATLYRYFSDVEAILLAWHERQIAAHLQQLAEIGDRPGTPAESLAAVLQAYALSAHGSRGRHDSELAALLHREDHLGRPQRQLSRFVAGLVAEGAGAGTLRRDVAPDELARFCLHALEAAGSMPSKAAVRRLVKVTLDGLRPSA